MGLGNAHSELKVIPIELYIFNVELDWDYLKRRAPVAELTTLNATTPDRFLQISITARLLQEHTGAPTVKNQPIRSRMQAKNNGRDGRESAIYIGYRLRTRMAE